LRSLLFPNGDHSCGAEEASERAPLVLGLILGLLRLLIVMLQWSCGLLRL
jgi:hypothetical protein